jgi:predicted RNA binding protein YcfA (HicA-like mRNA interferase family)
LAECFGFERRRQKGSHLVLLAEGLRRPLVVQDVKGGAKPCQVRQLLEAIEGMEAG